jgi:protein-S-isoprenylcysteine O-methyltransferase Ste14
MSNVAVGSWFLYVLVAFVLRTIVQLRTTGSSGLVGLRRGAGVLERLAVVLFVASFALGLSAPFLGRPLLDTAWIGGALVALATLATFLVQLSMSRSWRIGVDPSERTELVTHGPFAIVRNPIFSTMMIASVGLALCCPTPLALSAPVILGIALELQVRVVEEPYLLKVHGDRYRDYARRTGRFVPLLGCDLA